MLETCPSGEEKTNLFACIFLQRLPREIRVLLAKATTKTRRRRPLRRTSCGPSTTTPTAAAAWRLYRKIQTRILWPPSLETGGVAVVPPAGRPAAAKRPPGYRSQRLPRRPGWPPASASNTGDMARPPLLASSPAAGMETAVPGATKRGRPRPASSPHRQLNGPPFSSRHRRLIQHLSPSFFGSWFWSSSQESQ